MTSDIERRIKEHNAGKHAYTKRYKPWEILYQEQYPTLAEAHERELYLKSTSGRRLLKKVFKNSG